MTGTNFRYCFVLPDLRRPMGGHTVLYDMASTLRRAGHDVAIVHGGRHHLYPYAKTDCPIYHLPALRAVQRASGIQNRARQIGERLTEARKNPALPRFHPHARDVMVIPEFSYQTYAALFPTARLVMLVQDPSALLIARDRDASKQYARFASVVVTSQAAAEGMRNLLGRDAHRTTLAVARPGLNPDHPKKLQIAYMPRKLRSESLRVTGILSQSPALRDVPIVAIENMTNEARDQVLNESLIFLSFSHMEGFGLPPAEAMAAGCLVIGYTGVGGNEYFTDETGFVMEQHDGPGLIRKVCDVVQTYRTDPTPLDRLRAHAASVIGTRYTETIAMQSLLQAWDAVAEDVARAETHSPLKPNAGYASDNLVKMPQIGSVTTD